MRIAFADETDFPVWEKRAFHPHKNADRTANMETQ